MRALLFIFFMAAPAIAAVPKLMDNHIPLPRVRQATNFSCGCNAFLSIAKYWGCFDGHESALYALMRTTEINGTHPLMIAAAAKSFGLKAKLKTNLSIDDLRKYLARGVTVIINLQAWRDDGLPWKEEQNAGHYVGLVGIDSENAYFNDSSVPLEMGYAYAPIPEFLERWHDYEIEDGKEVHYVRAGILISGTGLIKRPVLPLGPLVRME